MLRLLPRALPVTFVLLSLALAPVRSGAVTVSVAPAETTVTVGDSFCVRVTTGPFPDLKGYQLIYGYDPARVSSTGVLPGDVLTGSGWPYSAFVVPDAAAPADTVWYDAAVLFGSSSGPGILAFFCFQAEHEGDCVIRCEFVDFRDSNNVRTLPDCAGALVHIGGPTPARPSSWGRLKTMYR